MVACVSCIENAYVLGLGRPGGYQAFSGLEAQKVYWQAVAYVKFSHDALLFVRASLCFASPGFWRDFSCARRTSSAITPYCLVGWLTSTWPSVGLADFGFPHDSDELLAQAFGVQVYVRKCRIFKAVGLFQQLLAQGGDGDQLAAAVEAVGFTDYEAA